ncbi:hypothetical protein [Komagataeibacter rhaeticus]|nr:hypothetical protein [Komagataeibacter rhaeticus]
MPASPTWPVHQGCPCSAPATRHGLDFMPALPICPDTACLLPEVRR